jgi:hypothetical protein
MASEADPFIIQFLGNYTPRKDRRPLPVAPNPRPAKPGLTAASPGRPGDGP